MGVKKPFSRGISGLLCLMMLSGFAFAESNEVSQEPSEETFFFEEEISEQPLTEQALYEPEEDDIVGAASAGACGSIYGDGVSLSASDLSAYSHPSRFSGYNVLKGIDVSEFQGDIDWAKVKKAGVEFAIIRIGGRYSGSGNFYEDYRFEQNIQGALAQGIKSARTSVWEKPYCSGAA